MWKFSEFSDYILFCTNLQMDWYELGYLYNQYLRADTRMFYRYVSKWKGIRPDSILIDDVDSN